MILILNDDIIEKIIKYNFNDKNICLVCKTFSNYLLYKNQIFYFNKFYNILNKVRIYKNIKKKLNIEYFPLYKFKYASIIKNVFSIHFSFDNISWLNEELLFLKNEFDINI